MKERWFNFRPLCLVFGFLILGSVFSFYSSKHKLFSLLIMLLIIFLLLALAIYKKKPQYILVPLISFVLGFSFSHLAILNFNKANNYSPNLIEARIYNVSDIKESSGDEYNSILTVIIFLNSSIISYLGIKYVQLMISILSLI